MSYQKCKNGPVKTREERKNADARTGLSVFVSINWAIKSPMVMMAHVMDRSPRPHHHCHRIGRGCRLITAYAAKLYNSAYLEADLPILPLSFFSILKCAELMVAKSVIAIPETLAPTLSFSTTASGSCPAPPALI